MDTSFIAGFWNRNKYFFKSILIGFLVLVMLIPSFFVQDLVRERENRRDEVVEEVSAKWAGSQTLYGPCLLIPYGTATAGGEQKMLYLLPASLEIRGELLPQLKHRSIYPVPLYSSQLSLQGQFRLKEALPVPLAELRLSEARLCLGIHDFRGIRDQPALKWNDSLLLAEPGVPANGLLSSGISAAVPLTADFFSGTEVGFSVQLSLKGSQRLQFVPAGSLTTVQLSSSWPHPSFCGHYLPDSSQVGAKGFSAAWKILQYNRNYPAVFTRPDPELFEQGAFGVQLHQPVDNYAQTHRSVKYALMVIALTFFVCFFIEIYSRLGLHPLQYVLIGFALVIFYTLLLSLSEYLTFGQAYLAAASATLGLLAWYVHSIFRRRGVVLAFSLILSLLYGFIYVLISLEDTALLFGSAGLFLILAAVMYFSRKISLSGDATTPGTKRWSASGLTVQNNLE